MMKTKRAHLGNVRPIRASTFLDNPSLYPEYAVLTAKLPTLHALRHGFHVHRTAALTLAVAVCMAISGVPVPPIDGTAAADEWLNYFFRSMAIDRLAEHLEGLTSGLVAMGVVALISIAVYPLHSLTSRLMAVTPTATPTNGDTKAAAVPPSSGGGGDGPSFGAYVIAVGLPSAAVWTFAVWAQRRSVWGLGTGLWFALYCACVTLKITSFVRSAGAATSGAAAAAGPGPSEVAPDVDSVNGASHAAPLFLTFSEYLFFLFLSPSLVCEMHLMKVGVRRKGRPLRAASEFFHAVLTFLCAHCIVGVVLAPAMRLFFAGVRPGWVESDGPAWAALEAAGGAGWPSWTAGSALVGVDGEDAAGSGLARFLVLLGCLLWMLFIVSSSIHFLVFYAFWHCVCLGMAELWGFPDRNLYGCWWLLFDEPRDFLRMWSVPVHRWLSACVHWPMLELTRGNGGRGSSSSSSSNSGVAETLATSSAVNVTGSAAGSGAISSSSPSLVSTPPPVKKREWLAAVFMTFFVSVVFHEAVVYLAMRGTCWPFNTFLLCVGGSLVSSWDYLFPVLRRPANDKNAKRTTSAAVVSGGDGGSEVVGPDEAKTQESSSSCSTPGGKEVKVVKAYGHRGTLSVVVFNVSIQLSAFICDCAAWFWWRHVHMKR